ncbi:MAG: hypothetical protein V1763_02145 [Parcubacteria group bacterium]
MEKALTGTTIGPVTSVTPLPAVSAMARPIQVDINTLTLERIIT